VIRSEFARTRGNNMSEKTMNSLQAIIALNTVSRNILLAKLAYAQGAISNEVVQKVKETSLLAMDIILKSCIDANVKRELRKIVTQIKKELFA